MCVSVYEEYEPQSLPSQISPVFKEGESPAGAGLEHGGPEEEEEEETVPVDGSTLSGETASQNLPPEAMDERNAQSRQESAAVGRLLESAAKSEPLLESRELDAGGIPKDARPSSPRVALHTGVERSDKTLVAESQETVANGPIDVNVWVLSPSEYAALPSPPAITVVKRTGVAPVTNSHLLPDRAAKKVASRMTSVSTDYNPSLSIDDTDPKLSIAGMGTRPIVKFGNILDSCTEEDRLVKPKAQGGAHKETGGSKWKQHPWEQSIGKMVMGFFPVCLDTNQLESVSWAGCAQKLIGN